MPSATRTAERRLRRASIVLDALKRHVVDEPDALLDDEKLDVAWGQALRAYGGDAEAARKEILRWGVINGCQRDQLMATLKAFKEAKPAFGLVLSPPFDIRENGSVRRFVYAAPLGKAGAAPAPFLIVNGQDESDPADEAAEAAAQEDLPDPPYFGFVDPATQTFLAPASDVPEPPLTANILDVVSARADSDFEGLGEIEVEDGKLVYARRELAHDVEGRIEEGEDVRVRACEGFASAIYESKDKAHEEWLEFPSLAGPALSQMVWPRWLHDEWARDVRYMVQGRAVMVCCVGPTGLGKTDGAIRAGRDAARKRPECKGLAIIRCGPSYAGSPYVNQYARNLGRAVRRARKLAAKGYIVVILFDEADSVLGEMDGYEGAHDRKTRLAAQELLSTDIPGVAVYLTMNPRRNSWLPAAIRRRFRIRSYPRPNRTQLARVAGLYVWDGALEMLGMSRDEFGGVLADNLYADDRILARAHFHSGTVFDVRARDLHNASPGKVRDLVLTFSREIEDGEMHGIEDLWKMIDREFVAPDLNRRNFYEVTFLKEPADDTLRTVELLR